MNRIEEIKKKYPHSYYSDSSFRIAKEDMEYLLRIAEGAEFLLNHVNRDYSEWSEPLRKAINDE